MARLISRKMVDHIMGSIFLIIFLVNAYCTFKYQDNLVTHISFAVIFLYFAIAAFRNKIFWWK